MIRSMEYDRQIGVLLAEKLGLKVNKREGHDLAGPCIACKSSDAFRVHMQKGIAQCYSCGGRWSPFDLAETVLGDREQAKALMVELGIFEPRPSRSGYTASKVARDPVELIAKAKGVTPESLRAFGAKAQGQSIIRLPAFGPDGKQCTHFDLSISGGKGKFAGRKNAGLFFPHRDGKVRLPEPGETWHLVEGPKDAAALYGLELLACGLNTCRLAAKFARLFKGVDVILIPDRDAAGEEGAQKSARVLRGVASSVRVAVLPAEFKESDGEDVCDVLRRPDGRELVLQAIADAQAVELEKKAGTSSGEKKASQATLAAQLSSDWELWHTPDGEAYVTVPVGEHRETWPVRSRTCRQFLAKQFYDKYGKAMNSEAQRAAINLIEARALFDGSEQPVFIRVAEHDDKIYVDLCNDDWEAVEISQDGWRVVPTPPVKFRRCDGMLAIPTPRSGGKLEELRTFLNVDDDIWYLVVAWLAAALRPNSPIPLLVLTGEQGSAKSVTARILQQLIDPNSAPLRSCPQDDRNLVISGHNSWLLCYDNISSIKSWLSDAFCRLSTGGGFAIRALYTDLDQVIVDLKRPIVLTSIEEVATRSDLLDRCLVVFLPVISEERRKVEREIMEDVEEARARIFGALLDAVAGALRHVPSIKPDKLPRMADFFVWGIAIEKALGWAEDTFASAYERNRATANEVALEAFSVAQPLVELLDERGEWKGTCTELLEELESRVSDKVKQRRNWPANAQSLSRCLNRMRPNLRKFGWELDRLRDSQSRTWSFRRRTNDASCDPFASQRAPAPAMRSDATECNPFRDDANDADDANPGKSSAGPERIGNSWEEGEL